MRDDCDCDNCQRERLLEANGTLHAIDLGANEVIGAARKRYEDLCEKNGEAAMPLGHIGIILIAAVRDCQAKGLESSEWMQTAVKAWNSEKMRSEHRAEKRQ